MALYTMELDSVVSLLDEQTTSSLWSAGQDDFIKGQGSLEFGGSTGNLADELLEEIDGQHSRGISLSEELPEWMSEKVSLSQWIDAADIMPSDLLTDVPLPSSKVMSTAPAEELLQTLMVNDRIPPQPPSPGEQQAPNLLALSPADCLYTYSSELQMSPVPSPCNTKSTTSDANPSTHELWQIVDSLGTIYNMDLLEDNQSQLNPQSDPESSSASPRHPQLPSQDSDDEGSVSTQSEPEGRSRAKPKLKSVNPDTKKVKKRDQNKMAATRYRQKKRLESDSLEQEQLELEETNKELKDKVESLAREIKYLKDLMAEVYKVKGELKILRN